MSAPTLPDGWTVEKYSRPASSFRYNPSVRWAVISPDGMRFGGFKTKKEAIAWAIELVGRQS